MSKKSTESFDKRWERVRKRSRRRYIGAIIALILVILFGGIFCAVLIHLKVNGLLDGLTSILKAFFVARDIDVTIVIFWLLAIPVVLILILAVNFVRRLRFRNYSKTWEETAKLAVEQEKFENRQKEEKLKHVKRFGTLNEISPPVKDIADTRAVSSLAQLCEGFRLFAEGELNLSYTPAQIREFIASLAVSRIIIIQGMSGMGKTSLAYAFGEYIDTPSTIIPVQPMWKERSDLLGYFNEFTKKYNETPLLKKMYEANKSGDMYITVLDEMNIARVEYYFAEFLSLLEIPNPELRYLEVVPDVWEDDPPELKEGRIKLPENMWFIGTANNDDSTFAISDKVYDRAMIVNLDVRTPSFEVKDRQSRVNLDFKQFTRLADAAMRGYEITRRNERRLKELDAYLISNFQITFGNRIMKQIRGYVSVYVSCGGEELEALDDILCKKVLRKLGYKDLALMRKELAAAAKFIEDLFGEGKMPECKSLLLKLARQ